KIRLSENFSPRAAQPSGTGLFEGVLVGRRGAAAVDRLERFLLHAAGSRGAGGGGLAAGGGLLGGRGQGFGGFLDFFRRQRFPFPVSGVDAFLEGRAFRGFGIDRRTGAGAALGGVEAGQHARGEPVAPERRAVGAVAVGREPRRIGRKSFRIDGA